MLNFKPEAMKIGYPAAGINGEYRYVLSNDFVESGLMGVIDTNNGSVSVIAKTELKASLLDTLKQMGVDTIITPQLRAMAFKVFREQGLGVYKAESTMLNLNVELLKSNKLLPYSLTDASANAGASCAPSSCSSCSSTTCK